MLRWLQDHQFRKLMLRMDAYEAELEQLKGQHRSLRSTFYARMGLPKGPPEPPPGSRQEKDTILRDFISGRVKHGP